MSDLQKLSEMAGITKRIDGLEQFRKDFATVWQFWLNGYVSIADAEIEKRDQSNAIRMNKSRQLWLDSAAAHFRQMASEIERDRQRSQRIAAEVRAEKEAQ